MNEITKTLRAQFTGQPATSPGRYQILFIHEDKGNGFTFSREVLQESIPLWEGASVFVDHSFWAPQSVKDLGGVLSNAAWSEEFAGLTAELTPAGPSKEIIHEAATITMREGVTPNLGFSADVVFTADATGNVDAAIAASGGPSYGGYVEPIVVPEWTDATDWAAVADPTVMPGIMVGERFGLVPQIFVAGSETDPAMFANDEQRIKVRHFIAVGVADFRPLHKSNVA